MLAIEHQVKHYYQPSNFACGQTALAILLSHYGRQTTPDEILADIPMLKDRSGADWGTVSPQLATWVVGQGFDVDMRTADFQLIDLAWVGPPEAKLLERLEAAKTHRDVPSLGREFSERFMQAYIDFIQSGGRLQVEPYMSTKLIDKVLAQGPVGVTVCYAVLHGTGRYHSFGLRQTKPDDLDGTLYNHFVIVYGRDVDGNYLIADPFKKPGRHVIEPEHLLAAMSASQIDCENILFQIRPRS